LAIAARRRDLRVVSAGRRGAGPEDTSPALPRQC
jgi:hypothetical protein